MLRHQPRLEECHIAPTGHLLAILYREGQKFVALVLEPLHPEWGSPLARLNVEAAALAFSARRIY